ncbi:MAG: radical SAM protein [Actinobacteria bacterium]|nr:radical SAM protein [Actinomycetota bacterium]
MEADQHAADTTGTGPQDGQPLVFSPAMLLVAREGGIQIQRPLMAKPFVVDFPGLHLLSLLDAEPVEDPAGAIAEAARRAEVAAEDLRDLMFALRFSKDLAPGTPWQHPEAPEHPDAAGAAAAGFDLTSDDLLTIRMPLTLRLRRGAFEVLGHDGSLWMSLDPVEANLLTALSVPRSAADAIAAASAIPGGRIEPERAASVLAVLDRAGLLRRGPAIVPDDPDLDPGADEALAHDHDALVRERFEQHFQEQNAREERRRAETGEVRPRVVPVAFDDLGAPAGIAMVIAYATSVDDGRLDQEYEFRSDWVWSDDHLDHFTAEPAVYLFSNYLWSHERCLEVSRRIKERSPNSITVHGGPDTPKYEDDTVAYFETYPHIDVTVRGEGEATAAAVLTALRPVIGQDQPDLSVLADVEGITYRSASGPVRTEDRDRIAELDSIPSPLLSGLLDVYREMPGMMVTIETTRGCPYGCTFCDWGSATTSRVRKYDIDRVYAELAWCGSNSITSITVADANFGMFARDVEIAEELARVRADTGYPRTFGVSYAKNTVKHLQHIIGVLTDADVMSQGVLSLQSMDAETLQVIHRSNIKTERYDALADRMREARLPLMVELMMGLPGQTVDSFCEDLQQCIEREVPARINRTTLLVNSPMNDPEYLAENQIRTHEPLVPGRNALVISTSSFDEADWREMERLRIEFGYFENYGVLRLVSRYVRHRAGIGEAQLYRDLAAGVNADPTRWPALAATVAHGSEVMAPIYSWRVLFDDIADYLTATYDVGGSGLDAVLAAQVAILPASGRSFPETVDLPHDVVGWYQAMLAAKSVHTGEHWTELVPQLEEFPAATLTVDDPGRVSELYIGLNRESTAVGASWELDSPLGRAYIAPDQLPDWVVGRVFPQRAAAASGTPVEISAKTS